MTIFEISDDFCVICSMAAIISFIWLLLLFISFSANIAFWAAFAFSASLFIFSDISVIYSKNYRE